MGGLFMVTKDTNSWVTFNTLEEKGIPSGK